ncbi:MAG: BTAD domain-containing putative transcriptional regulator, partial [Acidimicrobiia bacterium]|nr:BTAD domain-containing putative transcriptional regulator [Acidimicrobiia bacterium]
MIHSTPHGYRLDVARLDVDEFERLAGLDDDEPTEQIRCAGEALALWRGDPYSELTGDDFAQGTIESLREKRLSVALRRVDGLIDCGRTEEAIADLERLVEEYPFDERLCERLMVGRHRVGNTAAALRAFQAFRSRLGDELGLEPSERLRDLEERILLMDPTLGQLPAAAPHNLPPSVTSFVGREEDAVGVGQLLEESRLVTITGGPGIGKTRMALEVGHRLAAATPGGVWLARLASCSSGPDVAATIASAIGLSDDTPDLRHLGEMLVSRPALLILDNCEHVLQPVRTVVESVLESDGPLRILATSRQRLAIDSEQVWRLGPLDVPGEPDDSVFESETVRLLMDRIAAVDRSFRVRDSDPALLAELCRRTDGIPLAIELAASWLPTIGVEDASRLASGVDPGELVHEDGHGPLHAAVDWSLALLSERGR